MAASESQGLDLLHRLLPCIEWAFFVVILANVDNLDYTLLGRVVALPDLKSLPVRSLAELAFHGVFTNRLFQSFEVVEDKTYVFD